MKPGKCVPFRWAMNLGTQQTQRCWLALPRNSGPIWQASWARARGISSTGHHRVILGLSSGSYSRMLTAKPCTCAYEMSSHRDGFGSSVTGESPNPAVQPTGASRLAQRRIERQRRLAPVADLHVMCRARTATSGRASCAVASIAVRSLVALPVAALSSIFTFFVTLFMSHAQDSCVFSFSATGFVGVFAGGFCGRPGVRWPVAVILLAVGLFLYQGIPWPQGLSATEFWSLPCGGALGVLVHLFWSPHNPQGRANGRQPVSAETDRTSAAAASRRSP